MMRILTTGLARAIRRFADERSGTVSIEILWAIPFMALWFTASFVFFDVYRVSYINEKAAYVVADLISRREENIDKAYIQGMKQIFDFLINERGNTGLRVSGVLYTAPDVGAGAAESFDVLWSVATSEVEPLAAEDEAQLLNLLPAPKATEMIIVSETFVGYYPAFDVGITPSLFTSFIATQPRFVSKILCNDCDPV